MKTLRKQITIKKGFADYNINIQKNTGEEIPNFENIGKALAGKKLTFEVKDGALNLAVDSNQDGEPVVKMKLNLSEAVQESFSKGEAIEGVKVVDFKFSLTKLNLTLDTDRDGEKLLELEIDLAEGLDEGTGLFKKA